MEVRLLGPLEVVGDDEATLTVRGRAPRAVLAMLALRLGETVTQDEIVDGLWSFDLPGDPAAAVQVTLSRLRAALGAHRSAIERHGRGYRLDGRIVAVDVRRVEEAMADGRRRLEAGDADGAVGVFVPATGSWRGSPLAEFIDLPFAVDHAYRLHALRLDLLAARNEALLAAHRPEEVLDETVKALTDDPWREPLVGQLMLALYRTGRQVDALAAYARLSSALRRDFGIEPSIELQTVHDGIVEHDPALLDGRGAPGGGGAPGTLPGWFAAALAAGDEPDDGVRARLLLALGEAQHFAGEPGWQATLAEAGELARRAGDRTTVVRAVLAGDLGWALAPGTADERRLALLDEALGAGELDATIRARLLAARATERTFVADLGTRLADCDEALGLARGTGQPATVLAILNQRFNAIWSPMTLADRSELAAEAAALARRTGPSVAEAMADGFAMAAAIERADRPAAEEHFARFSLLADELDLPVLRWGRLLHGSWWAVLDGDLQRAEALNSEAGVAGARANRPESPVVALVQLAGIRWAQGRLGELAGDLRAVARALPGLGSLAVLEAAAAHAAGEATTGDPAADLPHDQLHLSALVLWSEVAVDVGDPGAIGALRARLAPYEDQFAFSGNAVFGPVALALGRLAAAEGDGDAAATHLDAAVRMAAAMGSGLFVERAERVRLLGRSRSS